MSRWRKTGQEEWTWDGDESPTHDPMGNKLYEVDEDGFMRGVDDSFFTTVKVGITLYDIIITIMVLAAGAGLFLWVTSGSPDSLDGDIPGWCGIPALIFGLMAFYKFFISSVDDD